MPRPTPNEPEGPMRVVNKQSIIRGLEKVRDEAAQMIIDANSWNSINPSETPFDTGADRVTAKLAQDCIDSVIAATGKLPTEPMDRLMEHITLAAEQR